MINDHHFIVFGFKIYNKPIAIKYIQLYNMNNGIALSQMLESGVDI